MEIRRLIGQAVKRQMVADVPVGAFLSGGLDSSTIVALMTEHARQPVATFSVGFGDLVNELPYARAVAEAYGTDHHELQMDVALDDMLQRMARVYDEPFGDSSNIPTYLMSGFAARTVKVALSGDGGDEVFGGYGWYLHLLRGAPTGPKPHWPPGACGRSCSARWLRLGAPVARQRDDAVRACSGMVRQFPELWDRHLAWATLMNRDRSALWGGRPPGAIGAARRLFPSPPRPRHGSSHRLRRPLLSAGRYPRESRSRRDGPRPGSPRRSWTSSWSSSCWACPGNFASKAGSSSRSSKKRAADSGPSSYAIGKNRASAGRSPTGFKGPRSPPCCAASHVRPVP